MSESLLSTINIALVRRDLSLARRDLDFIAAHMANISGMQSRAYNEAVTQDFMRQVAFDVNRR